MMDYDQEDQRTLAQDAQDGDDVEMDDAGYDSELDAPYDSDEQDEPEPHSHKSVDEGKAPIDSAHVNTAEEMETKTTTADRSQLQEESTQAPQRQDTDMTDEISAIGYDDLMDLELASPIRPHIPSPSAWAMSAILNHDVRTHPHGLPRGSDRPAHPMDKFLPGNVLR